MTHTLNMFARNISRGHLQLMIVAIVLANIELNGTLANRQLVIQPLREIGMNDNGTCSIEEQNATDKLIFVHGRAHHTCGFKIITSLTSYTVIGFPSGDVSRDSTMIYIERETEHSDCANNYVVFHRQTEPCRAVIVEESFRLYMQGNVSISISEISSLESLYRCPELIPDMSIQNVSGQLSLCDNVKGYDNQITCSLYDGNICAIDFPLNCDAFIGQGDVTFQCMYNDLLQSETLMMQYPSDIEELDMSNNRIGMIEGYSFQGLNLLQTLRLEINRLKVLDAHVFYGLHALRKLVLYENAIYELEVGIFDGLGMLMVLDLDDNELSTIPNGVFRGLENLDTLYLQRNKLHTLEANAFNHLVRLRILYLVNNNLTSLPADLFQGLQSLYALLLYDNYLMTLDAGIFNGLGQLTLLYLHNNHMANLPNGIFEGLENMYKMFLFGNPLVKLDSNLFQGLGQLASLHIQNIQLVKLPTEIFHGLESLIVLVLYENKLTTIHDSVFQNLSSLQSLYISTNEFTKLPVNLFQSLISLYVLHVDANKLFELDASIFHGLTNLFRLALNDNQLTYLPDGLFRDLNILNELYLYNNKLATLGDALLHPLNNLRILSMGGNQLSSIPHGAFKMLRRLEFLAIEKNYLKSLPDDILHGLVNLQMVFLRTNMLRNLSPYIFRDLLSVTFIELSQNKLQTCPIISNLTGLNFLNLRNNSLTDVTRDTLSALRMGSELYVSQHEICECYAPVGVNCSAADNRSPYLTCDRLLSDRVLVILMWLIGINALGGNMFVLIWRQKNTKKYKVQDLFLSNLALSDSLMGLYMIAIASGDIYYGEYFPMQSENWRSGITCRIAGAVSIASSEASVLFVTLISIDRFICIKFPYSTRKMGKQMAIIIILLTWICSLALGIAPSIVSGRNFKFYDNSHVCIGLPLALTKNFTTSVTTSRISFANYGFSYPKYTFDTQYTGLVTGLYFSTAIFLGLNCLCYLVILGCYVEIVRVVIKSSKQSGRTRDMKEQIALTTKVSAIVATDFLCWFPIIILGILVQTRVVILPPSVFAWSVTFVLPLNSAINPYLYTIAEIISSYRKKMTKGNSTSISTSLQPVG